MKAHVANIAISLLGKDPCYTLDDFHPYPEDKSEKAPKSKRGVQIVSAEEMRALWQSQFPKKA